MCAGVGRRLQPACPQSLRLTAPLTACAITAAPTHCPRNRPRNHCSREPRRRDRGRAVKAAPHPTTATGDAPLTAIICRLRSRADPSTGDSSSRKRESGAEGPRLRSFNEPHPSRGRTAAAPSWRSRCGRRSAPHGSERPWGSCHSTREPRAVHAAIIAPRPPLHATDGERVSTQNRSDVERARNGCAPLPREGFFSREPTASARLPP